MKYKKIDDYKISVYDKIVYDKDWGAGSIDQIRIYDFLNMQTYLYSVSVRHDTHPTEPQNIFDLDSLEGARLAYEELKSQGGNPPEINFPKPAAGKKQTYFPPARIGNSLKP